MDAQSKKAPAAITRSDRDVRPVLLLTAGRVVAFVATFGTPLVLVRIFDQTGYGTYKQLMLVYATLATIAQLGMAESLLYFLPSAPGRGGPHVVNSLLVLGASGFGCLGLVVLGGPHLSRWLHNAALSSLAPLLGIFLLLTLPATVLELVMTARKRYAGAGVAYGLSDLLRAAALVTPGIVTGRLDGILVGAGTFAAVRLAVTLLYLRREFGTGLRPDRALLREQVAYALPLQVGVALWVLVLNLHYYLVSAFVSTATFAIYAVGCTHIPLIDLVFTPAKNVMMVRMREAIAARRPDAALAIWHDTVRRLALVFFPLAGLLQVTARELIPFLYTDRYAASVPLFILWVTVILIVPVQAFGVLGVYADTRALAVLYGLEVLLTAGLVPPLLSAFGLTGAVLAVLITLSIGHSLFLLRAKQLMGVTLADLLPWRSLGEVLGAAGVSALVALAVKSHLPAAPLPLLAITSGVYTATYLGILAIRGLVGTDTERVTTKRIRVLPGPAKAR